MASKEFLRHIDSQVESLFEDLQNENEQLRAQIQLLQPKPRFLKIGQSIFAIDDISKVYISSNGDNVKIWLKSENSADTFDGSEAEWLIAWLATESVDLHMENDLRLDEHPF